MELDKAIEQLDEQGPKVTQGGFRLALFQKRMRAFRLGRRMKQRSLDKAYTQMSSAQRRERSQDLERKAHRRFEVAVGLRKNTKPMNDDAQKDVAAMVSLPEKGGSDGTQS